MLWASKSPPDLRDLGGCVGEFRFRNPSNLTTQNNGSFTAAEGELVAWLESSNGEPGYRAVITLVFSPGLLARAGESLPAEVSAVHQTAPFGEGI